MSESVLKKRVVYAGDVHTELMKAGWTPADAARLLSNVPDVSRSSGDFESLHEEIAHLRERAEEAEKQRDAALKDLKCANSDRRRWRQIAEALNKRVDELEGTTRRVEKVDTETLIHAIKECLCDGCSDGPMERCEVCCKYHRIAEGIESEIEKWAYGEQDLYRVRALIQADQLNGKEVWGEARHFHIFRTKPGDIVRTTIQYISLLKDGNILCHTQTCAFNFNEIGKTVFLTREAAEQAFSERYTK